MYKRNRSNRCCHIVREYRRVRHGRIETVRTHPRCCGKHFW